LTACSASQRGQSDAEMTNSIARNKHSMQLAAGLLEGLFDGAQRASAPQQVKHNVAQASSSRARGYSALATGILRTLCQARGLPCTGPRSELLKMLERPACTFAKEVAASKRPLNSRGHNRNQKWKNEEVSEGGQQQNGRQRVCGGFVEEASKLAASSPDNVAKVLQDAERLAQQVADVQREFQQRSRLALERSTEASALLDDIAGVSLQIQKRP